MSIALTIAILLVLLTILGAPLCVVILAAALIGFWALGIDLSVIAIENYRLADTPLLMALPLFTISAINWWYSALEPSHQWIWSGYPCGFFNPLIQRSVPGFGFHHYFLPSNGLRF